MVDRSIALGFLLWIQLGWFDLPGHKGCEESIMVCFCLNSPLKHGRSQTDTPGKALAAAPWGAPNGHGLRSKSL